MATESDDTSVNMFELISALILGLGALGSAFAGFEANQWGSKQMEAYGDANRFTTKASKQYSEDVVLMNADYAAIAQAKARIIEAREAGDAGSKNTNLEIASYIYTTQLSHAAYRTMGLPEEFFIEDDADSAGPAPAPAPAAEAGEEDAPAAKTEDKDIPDAALFGTLDEELDEDYEDAMLKAGEDMVRQADERFEEGNKCDNIGDMFDLAGIAYTIALFLGGLGLIFKTRVRWILAGAASLITVVSTIFMLFQPWTM